MKTISRSRALKRAALRIVVILALFAPSAIAANGKITGRAIDRETKEPLPGVNVVVTHSISFDGSESPLGRPLGGSTDMDGYYFILNVPPGMYVVAARLIGYTPTIQGMVKVDLDRTITLNFEISSSSIQVEQVVVTARREAIKPDVSATQEVIVTTRMEEMPILRVDEFVGKVKGVQLVSGSEGNGLSIRGGAIRETDVRMDGISLQDPRSENSYLALNSTSIEEIQVLTGGFEAKYGGIRSGLLNVVTKEGQHDRYRVSLKADVAPSGQQRFFGTNPWSDDSWVYKVYSNTDLPYAINGIQTHEDSMTVPSDFWTWVGWKKATSSITGFSRLDTNQRLELWRSQHPQYSFNNKPNMYIEGSITGPFPGSGLPLLGEFADRTTFLLGFKYEDSQLAFPTGPRNNYLDWNTQMKLTMQLADNMRFSVNGLFAKIQTVSSGQVVSYGGALVDASSSFGFLNNTPSSVARQASLLAGTTGLQQMFNKSRLQNYDQEYVVGGGKFTHTFSSTGFYTLDFQMGYTSQQMAPFVLDTSRADAWISFTLPNGFVVRAIRTPENGSPNGSTNLGSDAVGAFWMYGGAQRADSSHSTVFQFKGDLTEQFGRHHQLEAGISSRFQKLFVYTGTWYQSQIAFTPDLWQYYRATPIEIGVNTSAAASTYLWSRTAKGLAVRNSAISS